MGVLRCTRRSALIERFRRQQLTETVFLALLLVMAALACVALPSSKQQPTSTNSNIILSPTPPMGWSSWNAFGPNINEKGIKEVINAMVRSGMRKHGYVYVNLDDGWQDKRIRDEEGNPLWDAAKFPSGMKALGDFIHSKGMKFGIYTRPAWVAGHEDKVAQAFAAWGVDFVKYDFSDKDGKESNRKMVAAIRKAGRPIVFNVCEWGVNKPWEWAEEIGAQSWRTTFDLVDKWETPTNSNAGNGILTNLDINEGLSKYAGPGHWNDPDMLIVGLHGDNNMGGSGCTVAEYRTHMSLWCMMVAPLAAGNDVRNMSKVTREMLTNSEVIAVDQDPLGVQGTRVTRDGNLEIWKKPLQNGDIAVALFNRGPVTARIIVTWNDLGISGKWYVRDLWEKRKTGTADGSIERDVESHATVMLRLSPTNR